MITLNAWVLAFIIVAIVVLMIGLWASGMANRLNRLHIRTDSARLSLEGALAARGHVIKALQPELGKQVTSAELVPLKATDMGHRSDAENALLAKLPAEIFTNPTFVEASTRVDIAARFYNDAVADTRAVRRRFEVRLLRLSGSAPLPEYYEALSTGG
ncbi:hypothetical protein [Corynebacterium urogenitale]